MHTTIGPRIVLGLGLTGCSVVRMLAGRGEQLIVCDTRDHPPGLASLNTEFPLLDVRLGPWDTALLETASELIMSPGIPLKTPEIQQAILSGVSVVGDLELFMREVRAPVFMITGSNGKSTVATLLGDFFEAAGRVVQVAGNIGRPMLELLNEPEPDAYVLELSSFQLASVKSLRSRCAILLNICEDHLDWHVDFEDYLSVKQRVYQGCERPVVNRQMPELINTIVLNDPINFGLDAPKHHHWGIIQKAGEAYFAQGTQTLMSTRQCPPALLAQHQWANVLAALAMGSVAQLPVEVMLQVVREFQGLPHRCQDLGIHRDVRWINDSKATNLGATLSAINGLGPTLGTGKLILLAGGQSKESNSDALAEPLAQFARAAMLYGRDAQKLAQGIQDAVPTQCCTTLDQAVSAARSAAQPGDCMLLSPACASFDQFANFEARGQHFIQLVEAL